MPDRGPLAFIYTDAVSANRLSAGQLEFLHSKGVPMHFYVGGSPQEKQKLADRQVGKVFPIAFRRAPHLFWDALCLVQLALMLATRRYARIVYSTPKAMLIGSLAAFVTRQPRRTALVRGRAYENVTGLKRRLFLTFDRITFACSHKVLFVSNSLRNAYREDGLDPGAKAQVVGAGSSNGVDVERFRPASSDERRAARAALGYGDEEFLILILGRITRDKGIAEALQVARALKDNRNLRFLFVGDVEDVSLAAELSGSNDERLLLLPPESAPERYFRAADLHLLLSYREGLPNVVLEAAASGVPTFGFDVVGVRDAIIPNVTGTMFPFKDVGGLARAIDAAEKDRPAFRIRYAGAREHVVQHFEQRRVWEAYAAEFLPGSG